MAYNKASEEKKWRAWKAAEEQHLRELGVSEDIIEQLHIYDWNAFKDERRFVQEVFPGRRVQLGQQIYTPNVVCDILVAANCRNLGHNIAAIEDILGFNITLAAAGSKAVGVVGVFGYFAKLCNFILCFLFVKKLLPIYKHS